MRLGMFAVLASALYAQTPGNGAWIELTEWRWHDGHDPTWADPDFDDRDWKPRPSVSVTLSSRSAVDGWSRTCVDVPDAWQGRRLAVAMGILRYQAGALEVYVNGVRIGSRGQVPAPRRVARFSVSFHEAFAIPPSAVRPGRLCIAIRLWRFASLPNVGMTSLNPAPPDEHGERLGLADALEAAETLHVYRVLIRSLTNNALRLFTMGVGLVLLLLFRRQRSSFEYLWLGIAEFSFGLAHWIGVPARFAGWPAFNSWVSPVWWGVFHDVGAVAPFFLYFATVFTGPLRTAALWAAWIPFIRAAWPESDLPFFALGAFAGVGLARGVARREWDNAALALAIGLRAGAGASLLGFPIRQWGLVYVNVNTLTQALVAAALARILWTRFRAAQQRQTQVEQEMAAGARAQRLLLAGESREAGSYVVDPVCLPARDVGGDFYHVQARPDGGVVAVVGDVSGKGLEAALVASRVLGAMQAVEASDPGVFLSRLNDACCGLRRDAASSLAAASSRSPTAGFASPARATRRRGWMAWNRPWKPACRSGWRPRWITRCVCWRQANA